MWSLLSLVVSAVGVFVEFMSSKEEKAEKDKELNDLKERVALLEQKED